MNQPELVSSTSSLEFCTALSSQKFTFSPFFYNFVNKNWGIEKCTPKMDGVPQNLYTLQGIRPHGYIVLYLAYRLNYLFSFFFDLFFQNIAVVIFLSTN